MKIAVITDDGKKISKHFGRASQYLVVSIEEGRVISHELRPKLGHAHFSSESHQESPDLPHGFSPQAQNRHFRMAETIADCQVLIAGGMGNGAYQNMIERNIKPMITDLDDIDNAIQAYLDGTLENRLDRLH
jgi:predicted Fe-Mo cluster-binding NifX family protein